MSQHQPTIKSLIQNVLHLLSIRIRSRGEIEQYLVKKTNDAVIVQEVLEYLEKHDLIDDYQFAYAWSLAKIRRGKGDQIISQELYQKGVDSSIVKKVLEEIEQEHWLEGMQHVADKYERKLSLLTGYQYKAKLTQVLYQRGFSRRRIDAFMTSRIE